MQVYVAMLIETHQDYRQSIRGIFTTAELAKKYCEARSSDFTKSVGMVYSVCPHELEGYPCPTAS